MEREGDSTRDPYTGWRGEGGRFLKGCPGGPGRPATPNERRWRLLLDECVSEEDMIAVIRKMVEQAIAGNRWARRDLLEYTIGKPRLMVEFHGTDNPVLRLLASWMSAAQLQGTAGGEALGPGEEQGEWGGNG
jgi:hypothetical protein